MVSYNKNVFGAGFVALGAFFLIEHILKWNEVAFFDFIGHEWLGGLLIAVGVLLNMNWSKQRFSKEITEVYKWLSVKIAGR